MDKPDGEKTFGDNMIDGRIRLLELDEQACYPENHVKRKDHIPILLLVFEFKNIIHSILDFYDCSCLYKGKNTLNRYFI